MTQEELQEVFNEVASDVDGEIYYKYSGRGMFGITCTGITCSSVTDCIEAAAERGLKGSRSDSMGLDYIIYWPKVDLEPPNGHVEKEKD